MIKADCLVHSYRKQIFQRMNPEVTYGTIKHHLALQHEDHYGHKLNGHASHIAFQAWPGGWTSLVGHIAASSMHGREPSLCREKGAHLNVDFASIDSATALSMAYFSHTIDRLSRNIDLMRKNFCC